MGDDHVIDATIKVGGLELNPKLASHLDRLVVDEDLNRPAMFAITLHDPDGTIVEETRLRAGAEVEISIEGDGARGSGTLLMGDVVTVECDYDDLGSRVVVRGYAATHRLHRGRRTRVFHDSTDSDIVQQVADEASLAVDEIEPTSEVHQHVTQANLTDWEFLMSRARPLGFDLTTTDRGLRFGQRKSAADAPPEAGIGADPDPRNLIFNYNLRAFHGRLSAADQAAAFEVRGWDQDRKQPVVASVLAGTVAAGLKATDPFKLATTFGEPTFIEVVMPVMSDREAESAATALAERIGSAFAEAEGTALGNTALRAGVAVRVTGVSGDFNGAYVLSHVRHVMDEVGYRTHFTISGHHDRSLLGLVGASTNGRGRGSGGPVAAAVGLVRGTVSENDDPEKLGRVKVRFPWLDDHFSSAWAPVVQLGAGPDSGTFFLPAVGDEVLVGFEHGLVDRPMVVGGLFNKLDPPPTYGQYLDDGSVVGRGIFSRKGHRLTFHDAKDTGGIILRAVDGEDSVVSIGLNALDKKLVIQSQGDVEVDAEGEITLHGSKVTIKADGDLVLTGSTIKLN